MNKPASSQVQRPDQPARRGEPEQGAAVERWPLPAGIRSRRVSDINGLTMHLLEAGHEGPSDGRERPCLLLLHGFPELSFSWRRVMLPLAAAGYHVIAPDQRGFGGTTGWDGDYDGDLDSYRLPNLARDVFGLVRALGHEQVSAVIGHDSGAAVAAWCALLRPDVFRSAVLMSAPFGGPPALPLGPPPTAAAPMGGRDIHADLAALPRPRKHYQWYYSGREADTDMRLAPQGLHAMLRAYYHHKSADWPGNQPFPLAGWDAASLAQLPTYYVMDLDQDMAATVAAEMPTAEQIAANQWLPDDELAVYADSYSRTTFRGALKWYRCRTDPAFIPALQTWAGVTIDVPSLFIAGRHDWGIEQVPGQLARMQTTAFSRMEAIHLVDGAGHWVQQERPDEVSRLLLDFLSRHAAA